MQRIGSRNARVAFALAAMMSLQHLPVHARGQARAVAPRVAPSLGFNAPPMTANLASVPTLTKHEMAVQEDLDLRQEAALASFENIADAGNAGASVQASRGFNALLGVTDAGPTVLAQAPVPALAPQKGSARGPRIDSDVAPLQSQAKSKGGLLSKVPPMALVAIAATAFSLAAVFGGWLGVLGLLSLSVIFGITLFNKLF